MKCLSCKISHMISIIFSQPRKLNSNKVDCNFLSKEDDLSSWLNNNNNRILTIEWDQYVIWPDEGSFNQVSNMNFRKQHVQPIKKKGNGIHIMISTVHKHGRATCKNIWLLHQRLEWAPIRKKICYIDNQIRFNWLNYFKDCSQVVLSPNVSCIIGLSVILGV